MATKSTTTYTYTCDLCGAEADREKLIRLTLNGVREPNSFRITKMELPGADVCQPCRARPITDLLEAIRKAK